MARISGFQSWWEVFVDVNEISTDVNSNTSTASWVLGIRRTDGGDWPMHGTPTVKIYISGSLVYSASKYYSINHITGTDYGLESGTITGIAHNSDGTITDNSVSFSWTGSGFSPNNVSGNGTYETSKIDRFATITEYPTNFTDEDNPYFKFSNPANASMSCWLEINPTGEHLATRTLSGTSGTYTWNLTETERNQLRAKIPNSNTAICRIGLYSTIGGTTSPDYKDVQYRIVNANPDTSNLLLEIYDSNPITTALTGNSDIMVKGYSTLHVKKHGNAVAQKSATMKKYKLENVEQTYSANTQDFEISNYSKENFTFYSIDSRGNSKSFVSTFPWIANYFDITKGNISLTRNQGGVGQEVTLNFNGTLWNGNFGVFQNSTGVDNTDNLTTIYRYKKTTDTQWTTGTTTINPTLNGNSYSYSGLIAGDTQTHGFDIDDSYDFEVVISDSLSTVTFNAILGTGKPAIAVYGNKVALGDKYDTSLGGIQLWGDIYVNGNEIGGSYSTNEINTGKKWINGETIYRKVILTTSPSSTNTWANVGSVSNLSTLISINGTLYGTSDGRILPINDPEPSYEIVTTVINGNVQMKTSSTLFTSKPCHIILEYTKTTN